MAVVEVEYRGDVSQLQEDLENSDLEATVATEAGGLQPSDRQAQEGIIAGGVSKGLLAAGVLGGILSQLKSVTGIINAVFGAISRALIPVVEKVADFLRPFIRGVNEFVKNPGGFLKENQQQIEDTAVDLGGVGPIAGRVLQGLRKGKGLSALALTPGLPFGIGARVKGPTPRDPGFRRGPLGTTVAKGSIGEDILAALFESFNPSATADQTGEVTKEKARNNLKDVQRDKAGSFGGGN